MYPVMPEDVLVRLSTFHLRRQFKTLEIFIEFVLAGPTKGQYLSDARLDGALIDTAYWGCGATEGEALRDLLTKIKGRPFEVLLQPAPQPPYRGG